jgi:hypothetical protein
MEATISKDEMKRFKQLYNKAVKKGETSFQFKGSEVLVAYAKYVIEYFNNL